MVIILTPSSPHSNSIQQTYWTGSINTINTIRADHELDVPVFVLTFYKCAQYKTESGFDTILYVSI